MQEVGGSIPPGSTIESRRYVLRRQLQLPAGGLVGVHAFAAQQAGYATGLQPWDCVHVPVVPRGQAIV